MGLIILSVILLSLTIFSLVFAHRVDSEIIAIIFFILSILFLVALLFCAINFSIALPSMIAPDIAKSTNEATASAYTELLIEYSYTDIIALNERIELYEKIVSYNRSIEMANKFQGKWWLEYLFFNPTYVGLRPIIL